MKKLNFIKEQNALTRNEMKNIMAGTKHLKYGGGECCISCGGHDLCCGTTPCTASGGTLTCNNNKFKC
jgi:hypothetical protein